MKKPRGIALAVIFTTLAVLPLGWSLGWWIDRGSRGVRFIQELNISGVNTLGVKANHARTVALTFDDGPNPSYTEQVLKILDRYGATATFFLLGRNIQRHPLDAARLAKSRHSVGNHAFSHQVLSELPFEKQKEEILATERTLRLLGVTGPIPFRPPYGHTGWRLRYWLWKTGRPPILWSHPTVPDWARRDPRELAKAWINAVQPGAILLLHDGEGQRPETVEALDLLLQHLKEERYVTVLLQERQAAGGAPANAPGVRSP